MDRKYKLRYLTLAQSDLQDIVDYICNELSAPDAANDLVDKFDEAISRLELFPFSGPICYKLNGLKDEYRSLVVENYMVFYVVFDDIVEIRRILYGKRKYEDFI
ncbi:type II toxin-antitoxin system RelE/ParE family toxin [Paenibacillus sp. P32E]|uniref:type II toxin-antitoxin system RelE/ParE family toxin n=1 Tax=Paenibacillus sp. P32E TaxID=1349434 RepID=UPI000939A509|nr:type II toxin-antitoxin system RelE/ParE family toxin [Paenibacillus sp. P32E]OKP92721.1 plasmid stabilization protein [Paenibacillus sp. P32E]